MTTHYKTRVALVAAMLAAGGASVRAQDYCAVVELHSGERVEYLLADNPRIVQQGAVVTLTTDRSAVEYSATDIAKVYLATAGTDPTAIDPARDSQQQWLLEGGCLRLTGFEPGQSVSIYTAAGTLLASRRIGPDGQLQLPLADMAKGISIIKTSTLTIKINNK